MANLHLDLVAEYNINLVKSWIAVFFSLLIVFARVGLEGTK